MKRTIKIILAIIAVTALSITTVIVVCKPFEPPSAEEESTSEENTVPDGFYDYGPDAWYYYENGERTQKTDIISGTVNEKTGLWKVVNGMVDFSTVSLEKTENNTWQYVKNGEVTEETTDSVAQILGGILNEISNEKKITGFGNFEFSAEEEMLLKNKIHNVTSKGYKLGFVVMDLNSPGGFSYNADEKIYSASTIKGPYVTSLVKSDNSLLEKEKVRIEAVLKRSSNVDYESMRDAYGDDCFVSFSAETGNTSEIDTTRNYQYLTPRALAHLWLGNYLFFESGETGESLGEMFENPEISPIHKVFAEKNPTRTKAGWITKNNIKVTNDAGIVYTENGPYLVVIMTTAPCDFSVVENIAKAIENAIS